MYDFASRSTNFHFIKGKHLTGYWEDVRWGLKIVHKLEENLWYSIDWLAINTQNNYNKILIVLSVYIYTQKFMHIHATYHGYQDAIVIYNIDCNQSF